MSRRALALARRLKHEPSLVHERGLEQVAREVALPRNGLPDPVGALLPLCFGAYRQLHRAQRPSGDRPDATATALAEAAADVDLVIDYLWGKPAGDAIMALLQARTDRSRALDWIQIGSMAGPTIELPSVALRSANFRLQGNGQGAVSTRAYLAELPSLIDEIDNGGLTVAARPTPLAEVETTWTQPEIPSQRTVLVP